MGCYQNRGRALGDILVRLGRFGTMSKKLDKCVNAAENQGITLFGMDDTRCWTGENAASSYNIYGTSAQCRTSKRGSLRSGLAASETIFVYQKDNGKLITRLATFIKALDSHMAYFRSGLQMATDEL